MNCHSLVGTNRLVFQENKFKPLKYTYFHFKTPNKQTKLLFVWTEQGEILIWKKSSETWEPDFKTFSTIDIFSEQLVSVLVGFMNDVYYFEKCIDHEIHGLSQLVLVFIRN